MFIYLYVLITNIIVTCIVLSVLCITERYCEESTCRELKHPTGILLPSIFFPIIPLLLTPFRQNRVFPFTILYLFLLRRDLSPLLFWFLPSTMSICVYVQFFFLYVYGINTLRYINKKNIVCSLMLITCSAFYLKELLSNILMFCQKDTNTKSCFHRDLELFFIGDIFSYIHQGVLFPDFSSVAGRFFVC